MELFNVACTIFCGLSLLLLVVSNASAVPLTRIIGDSLRIRENNQNSRGSQLSHHKNLGSLTLEDPREMAPPSRRFPFAGSKRIAQPAVNAGGQEVLGRLLRGSGVLRSRRQAQEESAQCVVSADVPLLQANDLDTLLNATTFLGLNPSQPDIPTIPVDQPDQCPSVHNPWWPRREENLRSSCPWRWDVADMTEKLGADVYPRYISQARCLCETCVTANIMGCSELRQPVTVFQKIGCKNGLAVMLKKTVDISVGCFCQKPLANSQTTASTPSSGGLPPVDD